MPLTITPMDISKLYRKNILTDEVAGDLVELIPVDSMGVQDPTRPVKYGGTTMLNTSSGQRFQIVFAIEALSLYEALQKWPLACQATIDETEANMRKKVILEGGGSPRRQ